MDDKKMIDVLKLDKYSTTTEVNFPEEIEIAYHRGQISIVPTNVTDASSSNNFCELIENNELLIQEITIINPISHIRATYKK